MVQDLDTARRLCHVSADEAELLSSPRRPIVLLRKRDDCPIAKAVAPRNRDLGIMLPYTPVHHLLLRQAARPLVMTSGNLTEEPIACEDDDAVGRLAGIADYFLTHDRPIHVRCDDSVTRVVFGRELVLRRSRGYAPLPIRLSTPGAAPILACGGHLKNTFCLTRGKYAFLSHHIGDLEDYGPIARSSKASSISKGSSMSHRKSWPTIFIRATLSSQYALSLGESAPYRRPAPSRAHRQLYGGERL